ncbi:DUF2029 domain-containing protein [Hoyosella rhizosphaerae]|uniref:DUF2029 domain-containing protein n=1 Tax=Hoyosella rhizosphaerae TaxID=1755582 RepID=A0A916XDJ2_9ACTN|nr:glycosyltransferase 87 family protein [Hoyosella rhizosphaerae]MBN4927530.1 DUF2029 domain-containing protein [Hoyosella rhizosphaerae]GGC63779.1 hypothetical protein GCM10011410_15250 [Hoyosella rhizosphaerae]
MSNSTRRLLTPTLAALAASVALLLAYANKARCTGPTFDAWGRSENFHALKNQIVCYSDIQLLWLGRDINTKVFPYIYGTITPDGRLEGGTVEYPVLSGVLMWLAALPSENDADFLFYSALILAPFGVATAWLLGRLSGSRALIFAATPPLVLYGFHNWDLPVVFTAVAAIYIVVACNSWSVRRRGILATALLAVGFCLKIYPGFFILPLALWVLTGGDRANGRFDFRGFFAVVGTAVGTVAAINAPFLLLGFDGWRASIVFQSLRRADITTNSLWYWGLRPFLDTDARYDEVVDLASPALVLTTFAAAVAVGWWIYLKSGIYPWIPVSAAMLCGFLLFHKVHSPQFVLWLLPFFVLLRVPWLLIWGYLIADLAIGVGVFRYFYDLGAGIDPAGGSLLVTHIGVWGRVILLILLVFVFLRPNGTNRSNTRPPDTPSAASMNPHIRAQNGS